MKFRCLYLVFIFFFSVSCSNDSLAKPSVAKPYKRVAVFAGGGFEFTQFLGMMEALSAAGKSPDLIIASCGGGLAAMIVANIADAASRKEFIVSKEFRNLLRQTSATDKVESLRAMFSWYSKRKREAYEKLIPDIFKEYLVNVPDELPVPMFSDGFVKTSIPIIIVGGRALFTPEQVGQNINKKIYREIYFTSPAAATYVQNRKSPVAVWSPESSIESDIEVVTDYKITEAARASITSPFLLPPARIHGEYLVGGSIDLYPLELARSLGDEVIMTYGEGYGDSGSGKIVKATYQYDPNSRLQIVHDLEATWWVDFTDRERVLKKKNGLGVIEGGLSLAFRMPEDDENFNQKILAHYEYGKSRTQEALNQKTPNEKCHVRDMNPQNTSLFLRRLCLKTRY